MMRRRCSPAGGTVARRSAVPASRSEVLRVRVTPTDAAELKRRAAELERSVSWLLHRLVVEGLYRNGAGEPAPRRERAK